MKTRLRHALHLNPRCRGREQTVYIYIKCVQYLFAEGGRTGTACFCLYISFCSDRCRKLLAWNPQRPWPPGLKKNEKYEESKSTRKPLMHYETREPHQSTFENLPRRRIAAGRVYHFKGQCCCARNHSLVHGLASSSRLFFCR